MPVLRSASAETLSRSVSSRSRSASIMLVLNTATVSAIWPTSSLRPTPGISTVLSPPASARIAAHMRTTGREMPRPISQASTTPTASPASPSHTTNVWPWLVTANVSVSVAAWLGDIAVLRLDRRLPSSSSPACRMAPFTSVDCWVSRLDACRNAPW